jgi:hypothetical protein
MPTVAVRKYANKFLQPAIYPELARTDAARFAPGTYVAGQIVGQRTSNLTVANDVQTLTVNATGGTFKLSFNGDLTTALAWNVSSAALQAALEALPSVGTGNVLGGGGPGATAPLTMTFQGQLAALSMPDVIVAANNVTGGTGAVTVAHTTLGRAAGGLWAAYLDTDTIGTQIAKGIAKFNFTVDTFGFHWVGGMEWGSRKLSAPVYIRGCFRTVDLTGVDAAGIADLGKIVEGDASLLTNPGTLLWI